MGEHVKQQQRSGIVGAGPDNDPNIWRRWMRPWAVMFYASLSLGVVVALLERFRAVDDRLIIAVLAAASAVWYGYFGDVRKLWARSSGWAAVFLIVEATLWLSLIFLNPIFILSGFGMMAHVCRRSLGWSYAVAVIFGGGMVLQEITERGPIDWYVLVNASFIAVFIVLISRLIFDISRRSEEQQRLIAELEETRTELAAAEREAGMLAERHRLARDIHDTLAQGFTSIVMLMEAAEAELAADPGKSRIYIDQARSTARESLTEARGLIWALRSERLIGDSLVEALRSVVSQLSEETSTRAELVVTGEPRQLPPATEECLLRVTQEALANIRKHADASRVTVTVSFLDDDVALDVRDDGVGFEPAILASTGDGLTGGMGLHLMLERVEQIGGTRAIESNTGEGTSVVVQLPTPPTMPRQSAGVVEVS
ncbi:MAG: sensor histidine kinase [Actinobacteria bacterium]|nr:sensor histidine kinase [Actinomycetota bacterium]